jgi:hypothetical protein
LEETLARPTTMPISVAKTMLISETFMVFRKPTT